MALPFFYCKEITASQNEVELNEETSRHIVQVLRMQTNEPINLTDGKGTVFSCTIQAAHKKNCLVKINTTVAIPPTAKKISIAISLLKNATRFEWLLEKIVEIGVVEIIPLQCDRTEKEKFRTDRMQGIVISAMLQSQQAWLPMLHEPTRFENIETWKCKNGTNYIAHCVDTQKQKLFLSQVSAPSHSLICIGPEGDFTTQEIELALTNKFVPVSLGNIRLRTETAGIVAATLLQFS